MRVDDMQKIVVKEHLEYVVFEKDGRGGHRWNDDGLCDNCGRSKSTTDSLSRCTTSNPNIVEIARDSDVPEVEG